MEIALIVFILLVGIGAASGGRDSRIDERLAAPVPRVSDHIPAPLARQVGSRCEIAIRLARVRPTTSAGWPSWSTVRSPAGRCSSPSPTARSSRLSPP